MLRIPPMFLMSGGLVAQALAPASPGGPRWWQWGLSLPIALAGLALLPVGGGAALFLVRAGLALFLVGAARLGALIDRHVFLLTSGLGWRLAVAARAGGRPCRVLRGRATARVF